MNLFFGSYYHDGFGSDYHDLVHIITVPKKAQNSPSSDFGGLVNSVFLSVGSNITLTANTWIRKGFYFTK